ncbi:hypothetical protein KDK95_23630 [Actinospica sp. MGRD01-02]|uniref:Uncharacterized protein n=1 Tax=Actinospica acidithermotolerans TaxID=2828514 RepID=A0A941IJD1_9ACTN|nr:hypothetical protein [Actinospica acidithermotolerans]MBR7829319.1 hypothetical protein [Actinospica acidithermotolerans]
MAEKLYEIAVLGDSIPTIVFDPGSGASGRPSAAFTFPGGHPKPSAVTASLGVAVLHWTGRALILKSTGIDGRAFPLPLASRETDGKAGEERESDRIAEVAVLAATGPQGHTRRQSGHRVGAAQWRGSMHFLNSQGFTVLVVVGVSCTPAAVVDVLKSAGVPFRVYEVACEYDAEARQVARLLFPRARHSRTIRL